MKLKKMSPIKLLNLSKNFFISLFLITFIFNSSYSYAEESIDIWSQKRDNKKENLSKEKKLSESSKINVSTLKTKETEIKISENTDNEEEIKLVGLYEPEKNDLNLDMWSGTNGELIKETFKRIEKINLSKFSEEVFVNTIFTYSYPPKNNFSEKDFLKFRINWLIKNNKPKLIENFLNNNSEFDGKSKLIKYLVDHYIASADIYEGCKKANFINKEIKENYLEKFRIYCLVLNNKKEEAQLNFDLLREQDGSDKFFDDKILFLLDIKDKPENKILDDNLLNFYLSSVTIENFKYEPTEKTDKNIWKYLNAANMISLNYEEDKEKLIKYESAANKGTFDKNKIFEIYKTVPFNINQLVNSDTVYKTLNGYEARALIYQKILISDNIENKLQNLFLLKDLFKKDKLDNVYKQYLSDTLKDIDPKEIPSNYTSVVEINILLEKDKKLGKIKYDDKVLHRSKVIKIFTEENPNQKKIKKDLASVHKKIRKNKKYFYSIKDVIVLETLVSDGIDIPKEFDLKELSKNLTVPENISLLVKNKELGLLMLKIVEIIGSDEIKNLDPETIYFITNVLNKAKIKKLRNQILNLTLPLRA